MRTAICAAAAVVLWGCAGDLERPERFDFLFDGQDGGQDGGQGVGQDAGQEPPPPEPGMPPPACVLELFETSCNGLPCHGEGATILDLVSDGVADRLMDPSSPGGFCANRDYIGADGEGLLLLKVGGSPPCGEPMPLAGSPLSDTELECLSDWVDDLVAGGQ